MRTGRGGCELVGADAAAVGTCCFFSTTALHRDRELDIHRAFGVGDCNDVHPENCPVNAERCAARVVDALRDLHKHECADLEKRGATTLMGTTGYILIDPHSDTSIDRTL